MLKDDGEMALTELQERRKEREKKRQEEQEAREKRRQDRQKRRQDRERKFNDGETVGGSLIVPYNVAGLRIDAAEVPKSSRF